MKKQHKKETGIDNSLLFGLKVRKVGRFDSQLGVDK